MVDLGELETPQLTTYEPSDCRTFGMKNLLFRTTEPSDYITFGLESSHRIGVVKGSLLMAA